MNFLLPRWIKRYKYAGLTLLCTVVVVCVLSLTPQAAVQPEQGRRADSFVDSIGVATHLRYLDTAYGNYSGMIKLRLQELGIRHIRDGGKDPEFYKRLNDLASVGIKSTLVMDPRDGIDPANVVKDAVKPVLAAVEAVEGPNEWDVQPQLKYQEQSFPQGVRKYQDGLYTALKGDAATSALPVLMPSLAIPSNSLKLGYLHSVDMGNMHSYAGGHVPSHDLDRKWIPNTKVVSGLKKPIVATECGWHNATGDRKASQPGISEAASSRYVPRLYLEYFNRGIQRAFLYELINERQASEQEQNFGLLRYDGSPKPAFIALKNLISLLKDPGADFRPQSLAYTLRGNTRNVHHTLLQKRDGRFYLILWQEVPSFNLQNRKQLRVRDQQVTLTLHSAAKTATLYQPLSSIAPVKQYSTPRRLSLNVSDHPLVVELVPQQ